MRQCGIFVRSGSGGNVSRSKWWVLFGLALAFAAGIFVDRTLLPVPGSARSKEKVTIGYAKEPGSKPTIALEIYAASTASTQGYVEDTTPRGAEHQFWRAVSPAVSSDDISAIDVIEVRDGLYRLRITLSYEGGDRFGKLTSDQLHKPIAIYLNKKLWGFPYVGEPMYRHFFLGGDYHNEKEAEIIAQGMLSPSDKDVASILERVFVGDRK